LRLKLKNRRKTFTAACVETILLSFLYAFMTWLFFITKPSFMDILSFLEKLGVLFTTGLTISLIGIFYLVLVLVFDFSFSSLLAPFPKFLYSFSGGLLVSSLALILVDNFTYTVLGVGVVTASHFVRILYALGFMGCFVFAVYYLSSKTPMGQYKVKAFMEQVSLGTFIVAMIFAVMIYQPVNDEFQDAVVGENLRQRPNIILISNDGLNAKNLSVYGYERETTPFMEELAQSSLLMLNNFANANVSTGSEASMLTGKNPFELRVLYPPNTLQEKDMYEHLPGLLKQNGYRTITLGVPHFVDMNVINFKNAFDSVNCQPNQPHPLVNKASQLGYSNPVYFLSTISTRLLDRLKHIFFIAEMENPYADLTDNAPISGPIHEEKVFNCLADEINQTTRLEQPFFAHIHLVSTHGEVFNPAIRVFSEGQEQNEYWMTDFYDDAILTFDFRVRELIDYLKDQKLFEDTIFVVYSDHGSQWTIKDRTPLMIRFPGGAHAGEIRENTQNLDIAPTLLDYLELNIPSWMHGSSLIGSLDPTRLIYAAEIKFEFFDQGRIVSDRIRPPFYQFGKLDIIQCQMFYQIDLQQQTMTVAEINNYKDRCPVDGLDSEKNIWQRAETMLRSFDYAVPERWEIE
jgi:arylsulfatase A-like enzyme